MSKPFELIKDNSLEFVFLFSNADAFYVSARRALLYDWTAVGVSNAHQSVELYIKAILSLNHEKERGHDLVKLLKKYQSRYPYFSLILADPKKVEFLNQLSNGYLAYRYGEAGAISNSQEIMTLIDDLAFNLRRIYLDNSKFPSKKIYLPDELEEEFLFKNNSFCKTDITKNPLARGHLPFDN